MLCKIGNYFSWQHVKGATDNVRHENASKNQLGLNAKIFMPIISTALYVFHIVYIFISPQVVDNRPNFYCSRPYSSNSSKEHTVKCLGQFR